MIPTRPRTAALGTPAVRVEAREKAAGQARYATDHTPDNAAYAWTVPAAIARGEVAGIDAVGALSVPGALAVLTPDSAPRLADCGDATLAVLQSPRIAHRGQVVALAVAETLEAAREMAGAVEVEYDEEPHDVLLRADHPAGYTPQDGERVRGDPEAALAAAPVRIEAVYRIPPLHNHPLEPHASVALWHGDRLTVFDSDQGPVPVQHALAALFGIAPEQVTVVAEHVGGGFGSKGTPRPQVVLAAMAARHTGRPVKLALPRRELAALTGYRAPTIQRLRLGAEPDGRLTALTHDVATCCSTLAEFTEPAALPSRVMYAHPHSRTSHRVTRLDIPPPSWMRAPGECPGMFALETAMDELAEALGLDPVELRVRNEPDREPDSGRPFSSRHLVECLREGARRFGWPDRDPRPGIRREGRLLLGTGVAAATFPVYEAPSSAEAHLTAGGRLRIGIDAADIGTGARTVLGQIAADALGVPLDRVEVRIGRTDLPAASLAGGSSGTASWGRAVHKACRALAARQAQLGGRVPDEGLTATADTAPEVREAAGQPWARHAFGAQFAEVAVDPDTGEVRARRLLGVFAAGRILNPRTARSQFAGGMVMGLGMALCEGAATDPVSGGHAEADLASYSVPSCADVPDIEVGWIEEDDPHLNPAGGKGIGEIGIVGTAAAIGNALFHATGRRLRTLPFRPDAVLEALSGPP